MKLTFFFLSLLALTGTKPGGDLAAVTEVIQEFTEGANKNDISQQEKVMHADFRVVWNDTNEGLVKVLDRATYLSFIDSKKFGGGNRQLEIIAIDFFEGATAKAKVKLSETGKPSFYSFYSLVNIQGQWLLTEDLVIMK